MDNLLRELESMKITKNLINDNLWKSFIELLYNTLVPVKDIGRDRPCEEKDYREYREIVNRNLKNIQSILNHVLLTFNESHHESVKKEEEKEEEIKIIFKKEHFQNFVIYLLIIIGEQSEKHIWNNAESVSIADNLKSLLCNLCKYDTIPNLLISRIIDNNNYLFHNVLTNLTPKLLKDNWKTYPSAVQTYKWILSQIEEPYLIYHMNIVLPTALIILDDYIVENRFLGLKCIERILQHGYMKKELVDTGYSEVIYDALKRLLLLREVVYVIPLYSCLTTLLETSEYYENTNCLEWTRRDDVLSSLLGNMECEQNLDLRHAYMSSLEGILTNIGCAKWCERLSRILSEYCEHHTDLKTLKVTIETAKKFLITFQQRIPTHCVSLYTTFLKLHMDLIETPIFDNQIILNLEDCIILLYKLTPDIGKKIINDDRMKSIIHQQIQFKILNDNTYFQ